MKGVILAAGYATRFLPASKTIPKEMFPLIDRPVIDFIVQEMVDSGIGEFLLLVFERTKHRFQTCDNLLDYSAAGCKLYVVHMFGHEGHQLAIVMLRLELRIHLCGFETTFR